MLAVTEQYHPSVLGLGQQTDCTIPILSLIAPLTNQITYIEDPVRKMTTCSRSVTLASLCRTEAYVLDPPVPHMPLWFALLRRYGKWAY